MERPTQPHTTPTPEDLARMDAHLGAILNGEDYRFYAAGHRLSDEHDPRPVPERTPHVAGGPGYALALVAAAGGVVVGLWALIVALDAIAGTL